jgi:hypothetical protein
VSGPHIAEYVVELLLFVVVYWVAGHTVRHIASTQRQRRRTAAPTRQQRQGRPK